MELDFRLLRCAVAVAQHGNFGRAAKAMHVSQPSLSRSIQELESQLGVQLFHRTSTGVVITQEGEVLVTRAQEVLQGAERLQQEFRLIHRTGGTALRVGAGMYPSSMMIDRVLVRIMREYPALNIEITTDLFTAILPVLKNREVEVAVIDVMGIDDKSNLQIRPLGQRQVYCAVRADHPLLKLGREPQLPDFFGYPAVWPRHFAARRLMNIQEDWKARHPNMEEAPPLGRVSCNSTSIMKSMIENTDAWGGMVIGQIIPELRAGRLKLLPQVFGSIRTTFAVVHLKDRELRAAAESFVQYVLEEDEALAETEREIEQELFPPRQ